MRGSFLQMLTRGRNAAPLLGSLLKIATDSVTNDQLYFVQEVSDLSVADNRTAPEKFRLRKGCQQGGESSPSARGRTPAIVSSLMQETQRCKSHSCRTYLSIYLFVRLSIYARTLLETRARARASFQRARTVQSLSLCNVQDLGNEDRCVAN